MLADRMAALSFIAPGIAHEINNPNNLIMLNVDVLEGVWREVERVLDEYSTKRPDLRLGGLPHQEARASINELLGGILDGAQRIRDTVACLKEYCGGTDSGEIADSVDINDVIHRAVTICGSHINKTTRRFDLDPADKLPLIRGNHRQLMQVIIGLLIRACCNVFNRDQRIWVSTAFDAQERRVLVRVGCDGESEQCGIQRGVRRRSAEDLGKSVIDRIMQSHGGSVHRTTPGNPAIVTLRFPACTDERESGGEYV